MLPVFSYLIKSTICLSVLYLVFRWTLKNENLISLNRFVLISILLTSLLIPVIRIPNLFQTKMSVAFFPEKTQTVLPEMNDIAMRITTLPTDEEKVTVEKRISLEQLSVIVYIVGFAILLSKLLIGFAKLCWLLLQTKVYRRKGYNLALVKHQIPPMSFGRYIIISKNDYRNHKKEIINHELAHIKYKHSYDLVLVESIKLFHWFNPLVYKLRNDLKAMQEYQVDRNLLKSGINSKEYQLLLIKKCVGNERFALVNSFNHCQMILYCYNVSKLTGTIQISKSQSEKSIRHN